MLGRKQKFLSIEELIDWSIRRQVEELVSFLIRTLR